MVLAEKVVTTVNYGKDGEKSGIDGLLLLCVGGENIHNSTVKQ